LFVTNLHTAPPVSKFRFDLRSSLAE
jgi:hypothetical protein